MVEKENENAGWCTVGACIEWVLKNAVMSKGGAFFTLLIMIPAAEHFAGDAKYWILYAPALFVVLLFGLYMAAIVSMASDSAAHWLLKKLVGVPRKTSAVHQTLCFVLSCLIFVPAAFLFGSGDAQQPQTL